MVFLKEAFFQWSSVPFSAFVAEVKSVVEKTPYSFTSLVT